MGSILQRCFNPCFTGTSSHTFEANAVWRELNRFNPCFTGTSSHTVLF